VGAHPHNPALVVKRSGTPDSVSRHGPRRRSRHRICGSELVVTRSAEWRSASAAAPSTNAFAGLDSGLRLPPTRVHEAIDSRDVNAAVRQHQRVNPRIWLGARPGRWIERTRRLKGHVKAKRTAQRLSWTLNGTPQASARARAIALPRRSTRALAVASGVSRARWASVPLAEHGEPARSARRVVLGVPWPGGSRTRSAGRACR
jgi:hypothetical protein